MIKDVLAQLVNQLNSLDIESDGLILFDWDYHKVVITQNPNNQIIMDNFWILIENNDRKGRSIELLSSNKLKALRVELIKLLNNYKESQLVPEKYGFSIHKFSEILIGANLTRVWSLMNRFSFRTNLILKASLFIISRNYRILYRSLKSVKFS